MGTVLRPLIDPRSYRGLVFLLTAILLAPLWFGLLLAGWLLVGLLAVTPLVVPVVVGLRTLTWLAARLEARLARELLGSRVAVPLPSLGPKGYWNRLRTLADPGFWKQQTYLILRMLVASSLAIAVVSAFAGSLELLSAPITYRWLDAELGSWHVDTLSRAFLLVPLGLAGIVLSGWILRASELLWAPLPALLLGSPGEDAPGRSLGDALRRALPFQAGVLAGLAAVLTATWALTTAGYFWPEWVLLPLGSLLGLHAVVVQVCRLPSLSTAQRGLALHAAGIVVLAGFLSCVWAVTRRGYFWPEWTLLPLTLGLAVHAWVHFLDRQPSLVRAARSRALAIEVGVFGALGLFLVCVWAVTWRGYFWPAWPILGLALVAGLHAAILLVMDTDRALMSERIEVLTATRAGAVNAAEEELARIERDLHDGAQARLVALGMSLGMAEQKLATDPEGARQLLAEARSGAVEALRELRDLARGVHPPILTDRGLGPALSALATRSPLPVEVTADVPERPAPAVETAAYFVAAEALANAAKHAGATRVAIRIERAAGALRVEVRDDGRGGADPEGSGLSGVRRRVEALDGSFSVSSPAGGPTIIGAVLPCEP